MKKYRVKISRGGSSGFVEVVARTSREALEVADAQNPGAKALVAELIY